MAIIYLSYVTSAPYSGDIFSIVYCYILLFGDIYDFCNFSKLKGVIENQPILNHLSSSFSNNMSTTYLLVLGVTILAGMCIFLNDFLFIVIYLNHHQMNFFIIKFILLMIYKWLQTILFCCPILYTLCLISVAGFHVFHNDHMICFIKC